MSRVFVADYGTTSVKASIIDDNLRVIASASRSYSLIKDGRCIELRAEDYYDIFIDLYQELCQLSSIDAIVIDSQGETLVLADDQGVPLYNAINWLDTRAYKQSESIIEHFGQQSLYQVTGQPDVPAGFPAPKLLWFKEEMPEIFVKTAKIFLIEDYLIFRLTGNFVSEKTLQSSSLYMDIRSGEYWAEMLEYLGIKEHMLPKLLESGDYAGSYNGVNVYMGALDQIAGMMGAGALKKGVASVINGTTLAMSILTSEIPAWHNHLVAPCHYVSAGKYAVIMWSGTAGMALEWFRDKFYPDSDNYVLLNEEAGQIRAGSDGVCFLPYLTGSIMPISNPSATGAFLGLRLEHGRAHLARSVLESVACILKQFIDNMGDLIEEIRLTGGGAKSKLWCQIKADITQTRICLLDNNDTTSTGAAMIALKAISAKTMSKLNDKISVKQIIEPILDKNLSRQIFNRFLSYDRINNIGVHDE